MRPFPTAPPTHAETVRQAMSRPEGETVSDKTEAERAAFQAWYADNGGAQRMYSTYNADYVEQAELDSAWSAWQARATLADREGATPVEAWWFDVEDFLPGDEDVLTFSKYGMRVALWDAQGRQWLPPSSHELRGVSHWMHLPAKPGASQPAPAAAPVTGEAELLEYLGDMVAEGAVLMRVETDIHGDPARYRIGVQGLGETDHSEFVAADFLAAIRAAMDGEKPIPKEEKRLDMWEWDEPPNEEIASLVACLGDDAAQLRDDNPEDERAATMDDAAAMLTRLERANLHLFKQGAQMYEKLAAAPAPQGDAAPTPYELANPLGGPAKVFDAMADAIRAGDSYDETLRRYGFAEVGQGDAAQAQAEDEYAAYTKEERLAYGFPPAPTPQPATDKGDAA